MVVGEGTSKGKCWLSLLKGVYVVLGEVIIIILENHVKERIRSI